MPLLSQIKTLFIEPSITDSDVHFNFDNSLLFINIIVIAFVQLHVAGSAHQS